MDDGVYTSPLDPRVEGWLTTSARGVGISSLCLVVWPMAASRMGRFPLRNGTDALPQSRSSDPITKHLGIEARLKVTRAAREPGGPAGTYAFRVPALIAAARRSGTIRTRSTGRKEVDIYVARYCSWLC